MLVVNAGVQLCKRPEYSPSVLSYGSGTWQVWQDTGELFQRTSPDRNPLDRTQGKGLYTSDISLLVQRERLFHRADIYHIYQ